MFGKLFGKDKKKIDPKEAAEIEKKRNELEVKKGQEDLQSLIDKNNLKVEALEREIATKTQVSSEASRRGQERQAEGEGADAPGPD